jgi:dimethylaniline monooxygenase (N-oxide forming)
VTRKTCIIGAGSSGMVAVKALLDADLPCDCFEESDRVGGLWVFGNKNGKSAAYRSLSINTSRQRMEYADFPMPDTVPDYPGHADIAAYFAAYAERFGLAQKIRFGTRVEHVEPDGDGYQVTLSDGSSAHYGSVIVANGHHWHPHLPDPPFPGMFSGLTFHSSAYVDPGAPHDLRGRRVVVVGFGNSAVDLACELAQPGNAARVVLSTRRGAWVLPKYVFGRPLDQLRVGPSFVPASLALRVSELFYPHVIGDLEALGLPKPDHRLGGAHPTVSSDLLPMLKAGRVIPKPSIAGFFGSEVEFKDGSRETADAVIYATGYQVKFPFFAPEFVSAPGNELALYFRTLHPERKNLFFVGLAQPLGAIMPIAEAQAKLIADCIAGRYRPPAPAIMRREADEERAEVARRYVPSRRHTMQVDFDEFMAALAKEHARGRKRARVGGTHAR